jgi:hypothetical protein
MQRNQLFKSLFCYTIFNLFNEISYSKVCLVKLPFTCLPKSIISKLVFHTVLSLSYLLKSVIAKLIL